MIQFVAASVDVPVWGETGRQHRKTLLQGIDLTLAERRVAVIGANGSGKSTLLRLINGLLLPTSGRVLVDGVSTSTDAGEVRRRVGFVFTDPLSQLVMSTPVDDIELGLRRRVRNKAERKAQALGVLAERGLEHLANQSIYDLSGGERQLVALASVLAIEPSIVVADEPTTLLDLRNRDAICRALLDLPQQLIYATHDLEFAAMADRGIVVDSGRVVFDGSASEAVVQYRKLLA
ncbi:MAG TPA: ABC transporter ATP-binding protein [Propionibacteriaceae bacterium]|nr:ABC transporter ATP-binding protein [Propionibacteriaceae bacterium]